jgi:diguanylate cyclase (GGDEF)-like protein
MDEQFLAHTLRTTGGHVSRLSEIGYRTMHLDLLTLDTMGAFVVATAGAVLLVAWSQNHKASALALWGLANIVNASGIACLVLASALNQSAWSLLGGTLLTLGTGLIWKAARSLEAKPSTLVVALLGAAVVGLASSFPDTRAVAWPLGIPIGAVYLFAAVIVLWRGRKERLIARWPIVILTALHATLLLIGLYIALDGPFGSTEMPAIMSLFGFIHFEDIIFPIGTAVFLLAMVKERNEAASKRAAGIDPLTGIANRGAFMKSAEEVVGQCKRENAPASVIMCDLDRFKSINDTHGHAMGDAVLQKFCETVTGALWPNDIFGRLGGEEFALVLPRSSIEAAYVRAERIRISFEESCRLIEGRRVDATVSCGVSVGMNSEHTLNELLKLSDQALYRAKEDGRNRVKRAEHAKPNGGKTTATRVA